jgi:FkbM family methyltransferase
MAKVIIDLGANKLGGYMKLVDILNIDESWQKVFVEPNPENIPWLKRAIANIADAKLIEAAVSVADGELTLITRSDCEGDIAATTMGKAWLDSLLKKFDQRAAGYTSYTVQAVTIESLLAATDVDDEVYIKMDIEGAEFNVLDNFPMQYCPRIKGMFVEFHGELKRSCDLIIKFRDAGIQIQEWE